MAVRFDADGEDYTRALSLGSQAAYTVTCWVKVSTDRNTFTCAWCVDNGTGDYGYLESDGTGTHFGFWDDASGASPRGLGVELTVGTWYFWGISVNGAAGARYSRASTATTLTTASWTGASATVNMATLRLGESVFGSEWLNGCVTGVKVWTAALSQAEIERESWQYVPERTTNLVAWYPLTRPETTDYSGNGRTLSGGSGTATEDGPPISWRSSRTQLMVPVTASGTNAPAELTSISLTSFTSSVNVTFSATTATATTSAHDATVRVSAPAQASSVTSTASPCTVTSAPAASAGVTTVVTPTSTTGVSALAGVAVATCQGTDHRVNVGVIGVIVIVAAQSHGQASSIMTTVGDNTNVAGAFDATVSTTSQANAPAEVASVTATSASAITDVEPVTGTASVITSGSTANASQRVNASLVVVDSVVTSSSTGVMTGVETTSTTVSALVTSSSVNPGADVTTITTTVNNPDVTTTATTDALAQTASVNVTSPTGHVDSAVTSVLTATATSLAVTASDQVTVTVTTSVVTINAGEDLADVAPRAGVPVIVVNATDVTTADNASVSAITAVSDTQASPASTSQQVNPVTVTALVAAVNADVVTNPTVLAPAQVASVTGVVHPAVITVEVNGPSASGTVITSPAMISTTGAVQAGVATVIADATGDASAGVSVHPTLNLIMLLASVGVTGVSTDAGLVEALVVSYDPMFSPYPGRYEVVATTAQINVATNTTTQMEVSVR